VNSLMSKHRLYMHDVLSSVVFHRGFPVSERFERDLLTHEIEAIGSCGGEAPSATHNHNCNKD
ncbi:MAG: hypothetical protein PVG48_03510, partial [Candidatus Bathyarchaeota archaeon]